MKLRLFELAKIMAAKSPSRFQLGAVLARKGRPIAVGCNDMGKTHSKSPNPFFSIHAEFDCIRGLTPEQIEGAVIYVYRETKDGELADAKPCSVCEGMLRMSRIKKIFYTSYEGYKEMKL